MSFPLGKNNQIMMLAVTTRSTPPQDYAQAYMWVNLAAAQGFEDAVKMRDNLVKKLTPSQIEEGQRLAREWIATHTKAQATQ
jgi:TPR repeat protein